MQIGYDYIRARKLDLSLRSAPAIVAMSCHKEVRVSDQFRFGTDPELQRPETAKSLVPVKLGEATVYIEANGVEADTFYPVAPPTPDELFDRAGTVIREGVRLVGERVMALGHAVRPNELTLEFSVTFEGKGKASVVPVFVTAETTGTTGFKVTATWKRSETL